MRCFVIPPVSFCANVTLITSEEWDLLSQFDGEDQFELVNPVAGYVQIRDIKVPIESDISVLAYSSWIIPYLRKRSTLFAESPDLPPN